MQEPKEGGSVASLMAELQTHATGLLAAVEAGDMESAANLIQQINTARDVTLYQEVGRLTRELHTAIVNFNIDPENRVLSEEQKSEMVDAKDNLDYVIKLTQKSADTTMDNVEEGLPISARLGEQAATLRADWQRLRNREMDLTEFRGLSDRIETFLEQTVTDAGQINSQLNAILMAQDFQDLTGQVIRRVISLVQEVESSLVSLMIIAGKVNAITGHKHEVAAKTGPDIEAEGPAVNAEKRSGVVSNQDDVDDLLSSLGF